MKSDWEVGKLGPVSTFALTSVMRWPCILACKTRLTLSISFTGNNLYLSTGAGDR